MRERALSIDSPHTDHDVTVRAARNGDLDQLRGLDARVFDLLAYPHFVFRQFFELYLDCWMVAEHPTGLVGYSLGVPTPDRQRGWLLGLGVVPDHRRLGYGRRLTNASLRYLRSAGVRHVSLSVAPGNEIAIALYRQVGFAETGLHIDYFGPGEDRIIMTRSLAAPESSGMEPAGEPCQVPVQVDVRYAAQHLP
jgi:[ribosomal protein S18]-alanine N-acetyltransferase